MVVYGNGKTKYVLSKKPIRGDGTGSVYRISGKDDILAKIYAKNSRTVETRNQVVEAINGTGSMIGEYPLDVVYEHGKFVGYIFEPEEAYQQSSTPAGEIQSIPQKQYIAHGDMLPATVILLSVILGIGLSAALYFAVFPRLTASIATENLPYYFNGITMLLGGWIGLLAILGKTKDNGTVALLLNVIAYIVGCVVIYAGTWLLIVVLRTAAAIIWAVLPTVIVIAILVYIFRSFLR